MPERKNRTQIERLYREITKLVDLSPSIEANQLFSELVSLAISDEKQYSLSAKKMKHLQQICSLSEFELEKYWAKNNF